MNAGRIFYPIDNDKMEVSPYDRSLIHGRITRVHHQCRPRRPTPPPGREGKSEIEKGRKKRPFLPSFLCPLAPLRAREVCVGTYKNRTSERTETNLEAISAAVVFARQSGVVLSVLI